MAVSAAKAAEAADDNDSGRDMMTKKALTTKKTLMCSILAAFLCGIFILGFRTEAKAAGNFYLKINKSTNVVTAYTLNGKPYTAFVCSTGTATPIGTFYTPAKHRWWLLDGPSYGQYCTQITGNFLFHSVWYYQQDSTTQSYVQYNLLGSTASHGCVRLTTAAAKWIYDNCPLGTKVIIFNGTSADDPLGKPAFIRVSSPSGMGWDPTDPNPANPYSTKNSTPSISVASKRVKVQYKSKFKPVEMTIRDSAGNTLSSAWLRASGSVNTNQMGSYPVTYSLTDSFGRDASVTVTYEVGDVSKATITGIKGTAVKEFGSYTKLRAGVKAKNAFGTVLTDQIIVKVCKPGSKTYKKTSAEQLTLNQTGTYKIMYYLKNPTNKLVTKEYRRVIVKDTKKPVFTSEDNFSAIRLKAGTKSITYKKLRSGVTAALRSGKKMTSKISIKVTDQNGSIKTVKQDGSYKLKGAGNYTVTYYCANTLKNLKTGTYMVAKKTRKLIVAKPEVKKATTKLIVPADETVTVSGGSIQLLKDVEARTSIQMTDGTKRQETVTEGIEYRITFQPDEFTPETEVTPLDDVLELTQAGVYKIVYSYAGEHGNTAEYVRTITVQEEIAVQPPQ